MARYKRFSIYTNIEPILHHTTNIGPGLGLKVEKYNNSYIVPGLLGPIQDSGDVSIHPSLGANPNPAPPQTLDLLNRGESRRDPKNLDLLNRGESRRDPKNLD